MLNKHKRASKVGFILIFTLIFSLFAGITASASSDVQIEASQAVAATQGESVSVNIYITDIPGAGFFGMYGFRIAYDADVLTRTGVTGGITGPANVGTVAGGTNPFSIAFMLPSMVTEGGLIATITFDVLEDAPFGLSVVELIGVDPGFAFTDGSVYVSEKVDVDFTALAAAIEDADAAIEAANVLDKVAADVDYGVEFWTPAAVEALQDAIDVAEAVLATADATQDEVDAAAEALDVAVVAFAAAMQVGTYVPVPVNFDELSDAIDAANAAIADANVLDKEVADVDYGVEFWTPVAVEALQDAIDVAEEVYDGEDVTQADVDDAVTDLQAAIAAFEEAMQVGTYVPDADFTYLAEAIEAAEAALEDIIVAEAADEVAYGEYFWLQADVDALKAAIEVAEEVYADEYATQAAVDAAVEALEAAVEEFEAAIQVGTYIDRADLSAAIEAAEAAVASVELIPFGTPENVVQDVRFVTVLAPLVDIHVAIVQAQRVLDTAVATQAEIDAAVDVLEDAIATFLGVVQVGMTVDREALADAIGEAADVLAAANIDPRSAAQIPVGMTFWTLDAADALEDAIDVAQAVYTVVAISQQAVNDAIAELQAAIGVFEAAVQTGTSEYIWSLVYLSGEGWSGWFAQNQYGDLATGLTSIYNPDWNVFNHFFFDYGSRAALRDTWVNVAGDGALRNYRYFGYNFAMRTSEWFIFDQTPEGDNLFVYFDATGAVLTGWRERYPAAPGVWSFFDEVNGVMLFDVYAPVPRDGYWWFLDEGGVAHQSTPVAS